MLSCYKCKKNIFKKDSHKCQRCGEIFCGSHIYSRVDGNNRAITKNAPSLCKECYIITYR